MFKHCMEKYIIVQITKHSTTLNEQMKIAKDLMKQVRFSFLPLYQLT